LTISVNKTVFEDVEKNETFKVDVLGNYDSSLIRMGAFLVCLTPNLEISSDTIVTSSFNDIKFKEAKSDYVVDGFNCYTINCLMNSYSSAGEFDFFTMNVKSKDGNKGEINISPLEGEFISTEDPYSALDVSSDLVLKVKINDGGEKSDYDLKVETKVDKEDVNVGDNVKIVFSRDDGYKLYGLDVSFLYSDKFDDIEKDDVLIFNLGEPDSCNIQSFKKAKEGVFKKVSFGINCGDKSEKLYEGKDDFLQLTLKAINEGNAIVKTEIDQVTFFEDTTRFFNVAPIDDVKLTITKSSVPPVIPNDEAKVSANFTFVGINTGSPPRCMSSPEMDILVVSGDTKVEKQVTAHWVKDTNYYNVVFDLESDFVGKDNVSIFLKGPQHLRIKYGIDGQDSVYNELHGQLSIEGGRENKFDFTKFPVLGGDIAESKRDGSINGEDFSFMKKRSREIVRHANKESTDMIWGDLNGDCVVNGADVALFLKSLVEKQDQTY